MSKVTVQVTLSSLAVWYREPHRCPSYIRNLTFRRTAENPYLRFKDSDPDAWDMDSWKRKQYELIERRRSILPQTLELFREPAEFRWFSLEGDEYVLSVCGGKPGILCKVVTGPVTRVETTYVPVGRTEPREEENEQDEW